MSSGGKKVIKSALMVIIGFVVISYFYRSFYKPITTGSVIHYETYNGIDIEVTAIRDEKVLTSKQEGVISYNVADGGKIEKDGIVADIYSDSEDVSAREEIVSLKESIANLEEISGYNNTEAVDIDLLDSKIDTALLNLVNDSKSGHMLGTDSAAELLKLLNRRQIATGVSTDFSSLINTYKDRLERLEGAQNDAEAHVKSKESGYFVSGVDGYENTIKADDINKLTPKDIKSLEADGKEYKGTVIGKIVSDYEWYLAAVVSLDESLKLTEGEEMTLLTGFDSCRQLPVTVKKINKGSSGDEAVVIFSCTYMNSDLATMRTGSMTIVLETYSGLQVSSKAVRFVEGKKGVYVLSGSVISFVPIEVLYSTDNYCICKAESTGLRLKLYDEVIIKGKNLYDGKVIS